MPGRAQSLSFPSWSWSPCPSRPPPSPPFPPWPPFPPPPELFEPPTPPGPPAPPLPLFEPPVDPPLPPGSAAGPALECSELVPPPPTDVPSTPCSPFPPAPVGSLGSAFEHGRYSPREPYQHVAAEACGGIASQPRQATIRTAASLTMSPHSAIRLRPLPTEGTDPRGCMHRSPRTDPRESGRRTPSPTSTTMP